MKKRYFIFEIFLIGIIMFLINTFLIQICFVNGDSMYPTYKSGQMLFVKKYDLRIKENDIALINKNGNVIIKRIIGMPGDVIEIIDGYVYVNNNKFDDNYIKDVGNTSQEVLLRDDEYYVLGDNRGHSIDSRSDEIGIIKRNEIIGIVL